MKSNPRFVFDTNVIVSALLFFNSAPGRAFQAARAQGVMLVSMDLVQELNEVLSRRKFERYITVDERERFLGVLLREAEFIEISERVKVCRDPKDDKVLEIAANGAADYIVSGDEDLLVLSEFRGIRILNPTQFLDAGPREGAK